MKIFNNHIRTFKLIGLTIISIILFYGCTNDFLEGKPLDKISDADVWTDVGLAQNFVNDIYGEMRDGWGNHMSLSVTSDESFARERTGAHLVQRGDINPSSLGHIGWTWNHYYSIVARCNIFMTNMEGPNGEELIASNQEEMVKSIAEVRTLRAFAYHRLSSLFGGVPLITKKLSLEDDLNIARSSYNEVVDFIVEELDDASAVLPLTYSDNNAGRITKGTAMALKSRVLLYAASALNNPSNDQGKWQMAADAAKAVIDLNIYSLNQNYEQTFNEEGNFNQEIIWALVRNNDIWLKFRAERGLFPNYDGGWAVTVPTRRHVDAYETINGLSILEDPDYDPQNPWVNRDPRFYATILYDGCPWRDRLIETFKPGGIDSPDSSKDPWNASYTGFYTKKMVIENWDRPVSESSSPNWIMFRYTEILLNYAEAEFNLGNEGIARDYVNMVRSRPSVEMPEITDTGNNLMARIKNERRIEFYLEEHRFFDIRRWKEIYPQNDWIQKVDVFKDPDTGVRTISYSNLQEWALPEHTYVLPIPLSEIERNPELQQNPGY